MNGNLGAFAELMVAWEEQTVPIFSNHDAAELSLLSCVATTGLGMAMMRVPIEAGSNVVVFGAGPVGLSAIQGARIMAASKIVAVEPIRYRRDLALKLGATAVVDPNVDNANLVQKLREMTMGETDRAFAGGRGAAADGPDYVLEAVGGDRFKPKTEVGPDPTGTQVLVQAWQLVPPGGWLRTSGVGHPPGLHGDVSGRGLVQRHQAAGRRQLRRREHQARHPDLRAPDRVGPVRCEIAGDREVSGGAGARGVAGRRGSNDGVVGGRVQHDRSTVSGLRSTVRPSPKALVSRRFRLPALTPAPRVAQKLVVLSPLSRFLERRLSRRLRSPENAAAKTPAFCEVQATLAPASGSRIGAIYRLPANWNGKVCWALEAVGPQVT